MRRAAWFAIGSLLALTLGGAVAACADDCAASCGDCALCPPSAVPTGALVLLPPAAIGRLPAAGALATALVPAGVPEPVPLRFA